ncbi:MAG: hypothetical protein KAJ15_07825, partial [Spirochaetes bacterium]|nr:hypothetical protein [Spirochaetota bacterium]
MSKKYFKNRFDSIPFKPIFRALSLIFLLITAACSSLVYQPSKKFFYDPLKAGFLKEDIYLETA